MFTICSPRGRRYREHPDLWHVFHAMLGILPQAGRAVDGLAAELARRVGPAASHAPGPVGGP